MVKRALLVSILLISACANLSKNQTLTEDFVVRGGKFGNQTWNDSLHFKRTSWYAELTLVYDLLMAQIEEQSPFWQWLSVSEKQTLLACKKHYVVVAYAQDSQKISHSQFKAYAAEAGYSSVALPQFANYMRLHPDFNQNSFHLYTVFGLCLDNSSPKRENISLQFPNFTEVLIK